MRKIPTLFKRDPEDRSRVLDEVNVELPADAIPTVKWDGSCVMFDGHDWWKRREVKPGKPIPEQFDEVDHDPVTGKRQGWVPIGDGPEDRWFRAAIAHDGPVDWTTGTYEAVGPHFQGNPHGLEFDTVTKHGAVPVGWYGVVDFETLRAVIAELDAEGYVWWVDGEPVAKLKRRDFGLVWPREVSS